MDANIDKNYESNAISYHLERKAPDYLYRNNKEPTVSSRIMVLPASHRLSAAKGKGLRNGRISWACQG